VADRTSEKSTHDRSEVGPTLGQAKLTFLAVATAVVVANAYYMHPIIGLVGQDLGVDPALMGLVPAGNQIALALGILLLMPLGDRVSNRTLVSVVVALQCVSVFAMAVAPSFAVLAAGSTLLGFATIAPYLLPAYVSKRVEAAHLGKATAWLTSGAIAGVLLSRVLAGPVAEFFGWRAVYFMATALLFVCAIMLPRAMDRREPGAQGSGQSYVELVGSLIPIGWRNPAALLSGAIQALSFGVFLTVWLGLGLHLPSDEMGYGPSFVSGLALIAGANLFVTPYLGRIADRVGARPMRAALVGLQLLAVTALYWAGGSLWLLIPPVLIQSCVGPTIDVTGRMTILSRDPAIRTRLMTIYIVIMFTGGGIASWVATLAYAAGGWQGSVLAAVAMSALALALSLIGLGYSRRTP